jgi:hypothetical protein
MYSYSYNLLGAVREAASRLDGEFTYVEVCRLIKEEHPDFHGGDSQVVKAYLIKLMRECRERGLDRLRRGVPVFLRDAEVLMHGRRA